MSARANPLLGRRKYLSRRLMVNAGFQLRVQLPLIAFVVLYTALLGVVFFLLHRSVAAEPDIGIRAILRAQVELLHYRLWPLLGIAAAIAAYINLRESRRVAGPVYRLHRALNEMAEGEYKSFRLRHGDEFRFFEDDVALLTQKMKLIATRNRDILFMVHTRLKKLAERLAAQEGIPRGELQEAVQAMLTYLEKAPEFSHTARH
ncbi:MAG: hypothetical protein ACE5HL_07380 [Terriglobia bacterium]